MANQDVQYTLRLKDLFSAQIGKANQEAGKLSTTMTGLQGAMSNMVATAGITLGAAGIGMAIQSIITAGTKVEDSLTGLTTLLQDKAEASRVISNTMEDATKTPFAFEGLLAANKALIAADVSANEAREGVLDLANAIAATGGGDDELSRMVVNLQQIKNTGQATAMDIKQFAFAGVNLYKVLAAAGIKTGADSVLTYEQITMALKKAHEEGGIYYNGLENMANNTSVKISNFKDGLFQLSVQMYQDMKPAITTVVTGLIDMVEVLSDGWKWLMANKEIISGATIVIGGLAAGVIAYNVQQGIMGVMTGANTALIFVQMLATEGLAATLYAAGITGAAAWALMTGGLSLVVAGLYVAWQKSETFRGAVLGIWEVIKSLFNFVVQAGSGLGKYLEGIFTLDTDKIKEGAMEVASAWKNLDVSGSYQKGVEIGKNIKTGVADGTKEGVAGVTAVAPKKSGSTQSASVKMPKASSVTGQKSYNINIKIDSLVKEFTVSTTTVGEGAQKIKDIVTQVMLSAVNDSQLIAER